MVRQNRWCILKNQGKSKWSYITLVTGELLMLSCWKHLFAAGTALVCKKITTKIALVVVPLGTRYSAS
jgi:hypothetical protein